MNVALSLRTPPFGTFPNLTAHEVSLSRRESAQDELEQFRLFISTKLRISDRGFFRTPKPARVNFPRVAMSEKERGRERRKKASRWVCIERCHRSLLYEQLQPPRPPSDRLHRGRQTFAVEFEFCRVKREKTRRRDGTMIAGS